MPDLNPLQLSREIEALDERFAATSPAASRGTGFDPFLGREWPGQSHFEQVLRLDAGDPLRLPLVRWLSFFIDQRVQYPWLGFEGELLRRRTHELREPSEGRFSLAEMTLQALASRDDERRAWFLGRASRERALGEHRVELWARRAEVMRRLGASTPDLWMAPTDPEAALEGLAEGFLGATDELVASEQPRNFGDFVRLLLAEAAGEGLPARLAPDVLLDLWGDRAFLRGTRVRPFSLPARAAPSSFVVAFERMGRAFHRGAATRELPFVVAREPRELMSRAEGVLLAGYFRKPAFLRSRLGLSRESTRRSQRAFVLAALCEGRRRAAAVLLRAAALRSRSELADRAAALGVRLFTEELTGADMLGRLPVPGAADSDFAAFLWGLARDRQLVDSYDVDYFDNPRARELLRDEASRVPVLRVAEAELAPALGLLGDEFRALH